MRELGDVASGECFEDTLASSVSHYAETLKDTENIQTGSEEDLDDSAAYKLFNSQDQLVDVLARAAVGEEDDSTLEGLLSYSFEPLARDHGINESQISGTYVEVIIRLRRALLDFQSQTPTGN